MIRFVEIVRNRGDLSTHEMQKKIAEELFPAIVRQSKFSLWQPGDDIPQHGERLLIGVGPNYWLPDLVLLDLIQEKLTAGNTERIDVFDVVTPVSLDMFIEGLGRVATTPVVGYWKNGQLIKKSKGFEAKEWLNERYDIVIPNMVRDIKPENL